MRRLGLLFLALAVPAIALAQSLPDFGGLTLCVCRYDCVDAGAGQRIKANCVGPDGGVCYYPAASQCHNGVCNGGLTFGFEGPCTEGPTVTGNGYATAQGCAHSACYYKTDGGTCTSTP